MMGTWCNNYYFVQGSRVEGGAAPVTRKIREFALNTIDLRQMHRLGEKALQGLGKHTWFDLGTHCVLGKQLGVKFWMTINQLFGSLDFVLGPANVDSFCNNYQFGLLVCFCCYWFYLFDFGFVFKRLHLFFRSWSRWIVLG